MSERYTEGAWDALAAILAYWNRTLTESLANDTPPTSRFWERLSEDLDIAAELVAKVRSE